MFSKKEQEFAIQIINLHKVSTGSVNIDKILDVRRKATGVSFSDSAMIRNKLITQKLITYSSNDRFDYTILTQKGWDFVSFDLLDEEQKRERKVKKALEDKTLIDLTISKWQKNTFWYVFIGGLIGGLLGFISFLSQLGLLTLPNLNK